MRFFFLRLACPRELSVIVTKMNNVSSARFDLLRKDNYDTWKVQVRAVLIKNDAWGYVSGAVVKPEVVAEQPETQAAANAWTEADLKAQADIILSISPSEIKHVKDCTTAREI